MKEEGRRKGLKKLTIKKEEAGIAEVIGDPPSSTWLRRDRSVIGDL
jgi:hypothetical protein